MIKEKKELTASQAKEKALRLLEFRSHSEQELYRKLIMAGAKHEDLPPIMEFLKQYNFLDDAQYAKRLARELQNLKKYGKYRFIQELKSRGISGEDLENAVLELDDNEADALLPLVERKLKGDLERKNIDKTIRYFIYRGYRIEDIKNCIEQLKSDEY